LSPAEDESSFRATRILAVFRCIYAVDRRGNRRCASGLRDARNLALAQFVKDERGTHPGSVSA
jgi:hypothetical protein